jgi:hypothetical protein
MVQIGLTLCGRGLANAIAVTVAPEAKTLGVSDWLAEGVKAPATARIVSQPPANSDRPGHRRSVEYGVSVRQISQFTPSFKDLELNPISRLKPAAAATIGDETPVSDYQLETSQFEPCLKLS